MVEKIVWFFFPFVFSSLCCIFFFFCDSGFLFYFFIKHLRSRTQTQYKQRHQFPPLGAPAELRVPLFFCFVLWLFSFVPSLASGAGGQEEGCAGAGGICIAVTWRRWSTRKAT